MTKLKIISGATALMALGSLSLAHAGSPAEYFEKIDADANGIISQAEFVAHKTADGRHSAETAEAKFAEIAGDDGELTLTELEAAMDQHQRHETMDEADTSG